MSEIRFEATTDELTTLFRAFNARVSELDNMDVPDEDKPVIVAEKLQVEELRSRLLVAVRDSRLLAEFMAKAPTLAASVEMAKARYEYLRLKETTAPSSLDKALFVLAAHVSGAKVDG